MKRKLLFTVGASLVSLFANSTAQYMVVEQKSGEKYSFLLADYPVITFDNGDFVVNGSETTTYAISNVKNYHFTEFDVKDMGVNQYQIDALVVENIDDDILLVKNARPFSKALLVNISGMLVFSSDTDVAGNSTILLPRQKGVYVLTIANQSIKIIRK